MIFVDTSALVALADRRDGYHRPAVNYLRSLSLTPGELVVTRYLLDETITRLSAKIGHLATVEFCDAIISSALYTLIDVDERVFKLAWEWFKKYDDKGYSFTDCTSFVVMNALKIERAFAFDSHFIQAGFACYPHIE